MKHISIVAAAVCAVSSVLQAGVLVSETFDTAGDVSTYSGDGKVFSAYVGNASTVTAAGGKLNMKLVANDSNASPYVHIDLGEAKPLLSFQMEFEGVNYNMADNAFRLMLGSFDTISNFNPGATIYDDRVWAKVSTGGANPYKITAVGGAPTPLAGTFVTSSYSQMRTWSLFLNQSGSSQTYAGPDGLTHALANNTWTMFLDDSIVVENYPRGDGDGNPGTANYQLQGIILMAGRNWSGAASESNIGSIVIRDDLSLVPEPASMGLLGLAGIFAARRRR